jgi:DNA-binding MarR family transcriptional regulator
MKLSGLGDDCRLTLDENTQAGTGNADLILLEEFLPYRLSVLTNTVSNAIAEHYRDRFGLGIPDWRVLAVLARFPGSSAQQLVEHTRMDKVAVSRSVTRLVARGLLTRDTAAEDRRRSRLALSGEGEDIYRQIVPLAREYEAQLLDGMSPQHRAVLDALLHELQQAAERLPPGK